MRLSESEEKRIRNWVAKGLDRKSDVDKLLSEIDALREEKAQAEQRFQQHTKHVERFLSEMHATMIDPLAEGTTPVAEMCVLLLKQAREDRETLDRKVPELESSLALVEQEKDDLNGIIGELSNTPDGAIIADLRQRLALAEKYIRSRRHVPLCGFFREKPCDCGWEEALATLRQPNPGRTT